MSWRERKLGSPGEGENRAIPSSLERIFSMKNAAPVLLFDMTSRYGLDQRRSVWSLAHTYAPVFGRKNQVRPAGEEAGITGWMHQEMDEYGEPLDSRRMKYIRGQEAESMARFLFMPSTDPTQIQQRQQLLELLATSDKLEDLIRLKNRAYGVLEGVGDLSVSVGNRRMDERSLLEVYYSGEKTIKIYEDQYSDEVVDEEEVLPQVVEAVDTVTLGLEALKVLGQAFATQGNSHLKELFSDLPLSALEIEVALSEAVPFDKEVVDGERWNAHYLQDDLQELTHRQLEPYFFRLGAALEFARKIKDEGWSKVSSDPSKPYGYKDGWNLEKTKDTQTSNDGPASTSVVILSGANTSGKSYTMKTDFLVRVAGQALGFAPAAEANLPLYDSFAFLDRATTDPENNLSAFMREVENWKGVFSTVGPRTRIYIDEGYSTTSPQDQARLLFATASHIKRGGGTTMLATHNDMVLAAAENDTDMAVYHLQTEVGAKGELIRHFKLQPGANESLSLAVARARSFPESTLGFVENYLRQQDLMPTISLPFNYPRVEQFSEDEREQAKRELLVLERLFPNKPEKPVFHLFSLDSDFRVEAFLRYLSVDENTLPFSMHEPGELKTMLGRMIMWNSELSSSEILERQKMFTELLKREAYQKIHTGVEDVGFLEETLAMIARYAKDGINKGLNPFHREEPKKGQRNLDKETEVTFSSDNLQAAIAFLRVQQKLLGDHFGQGEMLGNLVAISNSFEEARKLHEGRLRDEDDLLTDEQKTTYVFSMKSLETINASLPSVNYQDIDVAVIQEELTILEEHQRGGPRPDKKPDKPKPGFTWYLARLMDLSSGGLPYALQTMEQDLGNSNKFLQYLRASDSVYLHQTANLLEQQINKYKAAIQGEVTEEADETASVLPDAETLSRLNHINRRSYFSYYGDIKEKNSPFKSALRQLDALCMFAGIIQNEGLSPVQLNQTGEVDMPDAFSIFKKKGEEVKNTISLDPKTERVQILTGPNGSGKTFYEKGAVAATLMGLATGYAPAESVTMPVFDSVVYLDRVVEKQDEKLSAFVQEVEYWKQLLPLMQSKKIAFVAVDEAFSTTSPAYQAAFTYAVIAEFLGSNHFLMLSTHNHDVVTKLEDLKVPMIKPYHFQFSVEGGKVQYSYTKQEGHETSHASVVARTMGLPEEITSAT